MGVSGQRRHASFSEAEPVTFLHSLSHTELILFVVDTMNLYEKTPNDIPSHSSVHMLVFNPNNKCKSGTIISIDENLWA